MYPELLPCNLLSRNLQMSRIVRRWLISRRFCGYRNGVRIVRKFCRGGVFDFCSLDSFGIPPHFLVVWYFVSKLVEPFQIWLGELHSAVITQHNVIPPHCQPAWYFFPMADWGSTYVENTLRIVIYNIFKKKTKSKCLYECVFFN